MGLELATMTSDGSHGPGQYDLLAMAVTGYRPALNSTVYRIASSPRGGPASRSARFKIGLDAIFMALPRTLIRSRSRPRRQRVLFGVRLRLSGAQPKLDSQRIEGKANPERQAKELLWLKMGEMAGGEE
jgi:hypothetical protein